MTSAGEIMRLVKRSSGFPGLHSLTFGLSRVLNECGYAVGTVTVLDRQPNAYASTYPSEIVTCSVPDGRTVKMFCKYESIGENETYPNRGDIGYESEVYRNVLLPLCVSSPDFYGLHQDKKTRGKWMILECLDQAVRVSKSGNPDAMALAARWVGHFHAAADTHLQHTSATGLIVYDEEYYLGWARRTLHFAGPLHRRFAWLSSLCERYSRMAASLPTKTQTVIHGEYYPDNILFHNGIIRPVDWQSAAIAVGEIDLAFLTDGWSRDIVQECEREYQRARWPERVPEDFRQTLGIADLYQQFLWLGSRPDWTVDGECTWRFDRLRAIGERMGLI
jgi:hypothetical protein